MEVQLAFAELHPRCVDPVQQRYEMIRPLVLLEDRTVAQRAEETQCHPETLRDLTRRFRHHGMLGLWPEHTTLRPAPRGKPVPEAVGAELARLKALYTGFGYRELARILWCTVACHLDAKTIKKLWQHTPTPAPGDRPLLDYHQHATRTEARLEVVKLYYQGWTKRSIGQVLHVSRPTIDRWIQRFEADQVAGLTDKSRRPQSTSRKTWLPVMIAIYHLQKRHPDAGRFRIWSLLANPTISERTVGRVMALNKQVYDDIPHVAHPHPHPPPGLHPYKATQPHQYWFIDGRMMDFALEGVRWWSLIILDGYSRTMLAGAIAPTEASWVTLMVLHTACLRYGAPQYLISDSGGAFTSNEVTAVLKRLQIEPNPLVSTHGESYKNLMETHFNIQRRLYDYQFSLTTTPAELEQAHQAFMALYNTTAHQGLLAAQYDPPIPLRVLGEATGRLYTPEDLARHFAQALFPRTTNQHGCVTLHHSHFYVEAGVPHTQVLLWVSGEQLRAVVDHVVLADYHCRYDWREHQVKDIQYGLFYPTRFTSPQGTLFPRTPQESLVVCRPLALRRLQPQAPFAQQLGLFERAANRVELPMRPHQRHASSR